MPVRTLLQGPAPVNLDASFSSPAFTVGTSVESYTATISWGDNTTSTGVVTVTPGEGGVATIGTVTGSHVYSGDGPYTVTVSVNDGHGTGTGTLQVIDAPPTIVLGSNLSANGLSGNEGSPLALSAAFSDLGYNFGGTTKSFTATINWGDDTTSTGIVTVTPGNGTTPTTGTITANHTYEAFGTFPVVINLTDEGGATGQATLNAVIGNVAPMSLMLGSGAFSSNAPFLFSGTFLDAGLDDTHSILSIG